MKILKLVLMFLFVFCFARAQNPYYDAWAIKSLGIDRIDPNLKVVVLEPDTTMQGGMTRVHILDSILKKYIPPAQLSPGMTELQLLTAIEKEFRKNPFLNIGSLQNESFLSTLTGSAASLDFSSIGSSIGGLDVTAIVNGVSQLMIERAKEELTISFFNRFQEFVNKHEEMQVLFPKTTDNLANLLSYHYPEMIPVLRTGFFEDMKALTYHLDDVLELPRYRELLRSLPEIRIVIRSLRLVHEIESGYSNAAEVLLQFSQIEDWSDTTGGAGFRNTGSSLKLAALFSESLRCDTARTGDEGRIWVTMKDVKNLLASNTAFRIYLGLLYQQVKMQQIIFYADNESLPFIKIMEAEKNNIILFENSISEFIELAAKADKVKDDLEYKQENHIALTNDDYYSYINTSIDVIEEAFSIAKLYDSRINIDRYTRLVRQGNDLFRHIYKEEYPQAVINAVDILGTLDSLVQTMDKDKLVANINSLLASAPQSEKLDIKSFKKIDSKKVKQIRILADKHNADSAGMLLRKLEGCYYAIKLGKVLQQVSKYGLFMANVVKAKTPEEVETVLENVILPVGSSSIKKNTSFNISVQSYLGAQYRIDQLQPNTNIAWNDRFGVTAPIGIAFSHGFKKAGSLSLFVSLFDIGAIVDYRLKTDSVANANGGNTAVVEKNYKIELGQIVSPGVHIVYGAGLNLPVSLGIGGQYGPGLAGIDNGSSIINNPSWRWNIILGVDIPFFNLYSSPKK